MLKRCFSLIAMSAFVIMALTGTAFAVDTHTTFVQGNPIHEPVNDNNMFIQSNVLDFGDLAIYATGGVTTADVVRMLDIQAGTYVLSVGLNIVTVQAGLSGLTGEATVGDGDDPNGWIAQFGGWAVASGTTTSQDETWAGVYHTVYGGKFYSVDDTIDMVMPTWTGTWDPIADDPESALTEFVVRVWAVCIKPDTQKAYGKLRP